MNLIPAINGTVKYRCGNAKLSGDIVFDNGVESVNKLFAERMQRFKGNRIEIKFIFEELCDEEYKLIVEESSIKIYAKDERGYGYALVTLYQFAVFGNGEVPFMEICDKPRYNVRSFSLDVCRHFIAIEDIKKIIEQCALLKFNRFVLSFSQDQGYRLESKKFPELNKIGSYRNLSPQDPLVEKGINKAGDFYGGYYTHEEIRELIEFARTRGIDIVPEIDLPGHTSAILAAYPYLSCSGKPIKVKGTFGVHQRILCAGNEDVYRFIFALIDEICDVFHSEYIHIGGDEAPKTEWQHCEKCNALMKEYKIKKYSELQGVFINKIIAYLQSKGKKAIVWQESAAAHNLDKTAVVNYWSEIGTGKSYMSEELAANRKVIMASMNAFYCDYSYAEIPLRATYLYEPNIKGDRIADDNVCGIDARMWTEWVTCFEDIEKKIYPRLLAVSENAWTRDRNLQEFLSRSKQFLEYKELNYLMSESWTKATVSGEEAIKEILESIMSLSARIRGMKEFDEKEDGGRADAVGSGEKQEQVIDFVSMVRSFITEKMQFAYTQEEIERAINMLLKMKKGV